MLAMGASNDNAGQGIPDAVWVDMPFIDLAVLMALLKFGPVKGVWQLIPALSDWCARPFSMVEVSTSVASLLDRGLVQQGGEGAFRPTPEAYEPAMRLSAAHVRMWQSTAPREADPNQLSIDSDWRRI